MAVNCLKTSPRWMTKLREYIGFLPLNRVRYIYIYLKNVGILIAFFKKVAPTRHSRVAEHWPL